MEAEIEVQDPEGEVQDPYFSVNQAAGLLGTTGKNLHEMRARYRGTEKEMPCKQRNPNNPVAPYLAKKSEWLAWAKEHYHTGAHSVEQSRRNQRITDDGAQPIGGMALTDAQRRCLIALSFEWKTDVEGVITRILSVPPHALKSKVDGILSGGTLVELRIPTLALKILQQRGNFLEDFDYTKQIEDALMRSSMFAGWWRDE